MQKHLFKAGDAVQLLMGDKIMTIDYRTKAGLYLCKWFQEDGWQAGEFQSDQIRSADRKFRQNLS
ncbi:DUF2158 domain-containing protein [Rufibacter latericius]|uniref:DUF2158 domain-containing protein n=1 Tax=Rufibacter latericius TaxID=2487040 RepID=A0A3M9MMU7_9BACT|nr:DUF2158 domain-containing protein [Rufibacter latericius]RNI26839.1 DUF2158 domain-containing protein [Rufibacter latericius]